MTVSSLRPGPGLATDTHSASEGRGRARGTEGELRTIREKALITQLGYKHIKHINLDDI